MKKTLLAFLGLFLTTSLIFSQNFVKTPINGSNSAEPYVIASGHLTNDLFLDIAIGTDTGSTVEWYKNDGDGTFTNMGNLTAIAPADLSFVEGLEIADIDDDGDDDILATSYVNDNLVWFENNGDETFEDAVEISDAINGAGTVKVKDIDNDTNLDVIVTAFEGNSVIYMLGNGDGTFGAIRYIVPVTAGSGPGDVDFADFDNDGDLDAVIAFTGNGDVAVYENRFIPDGLDGSGNIPFVAYTNLVDSGNGFLWTVSFADINDDNRLDIIKSDNFPSGVPNIAWYSFNDDDGMDNPVSNTTWSYNPVATSIARTAMVASADFNNDSFNDLLVTNGRATDDDVIWFTSNSSGGLGNEIFIDDTSSSLFDLRIADFDNDNDLDIVGISYLQDDVFIFLNDLDPLSVEENYISNINIYPNPTNDILNFKLPNSESIAVTVYDILGKNLLSGTVSTNNPLDVSELASGIYTIKIKDSNESIKFIKQ